MDKPAILGGKPAQTGNFPVWPQHDNRERQALMDVLTSNIWWRTPGTQTLHFEQEFARYQHAKHGVAVTNGTAAIEVTLAALGIGPGDEVIVPDFTFVATASAVLDVDVLIVGSRSARTRPRSVRPGARSATRRAPARGRRGSRARAMATAPGRQSVAPLPARGTRGRAGWPAGR